MPRLSEIEGGVEQDKRHGQCHQGRVCPICGAKTCFWCSWDDGSCDNHPSPNERKEAEKEKEKMTISIDEITWEDFAAYERVRKSGVCNMWSRDVQLLAGIDKEIHVAIISHYTELDAKWPEVRGV